MPYCPRCKFEYNITELICPECDEILVDSLKATSNAAQTPDGSWVVVGGVDRGYESDLAKGSLDSNNIPSVMLPPSLHVPLERMAPTGAVDPDGGDAKLIAVPREFLQEAVVILKSVLGDDFGENENTYF
ncbi:MAG TPA: hypothetical protein PLF13_11250 [candidate division Zixibacteria bacterium]|nr:hypothetical protein [candidate division Zixibacteria bacterium]